MYLKSDLVGGEKKKSLPEAQKICLQLEGTETGGAG